MPNKTSSLSQGFCSGVFTLVRNPDVLSPILVSSFGSVVKHEVESESPCRGCCSGVASKDQILRLRNHHGSTLPKAMTWYVGAVNSSWCAGCRSWKRDRGTPLLLQDQERCEQSPERWNPVGFECCAGARESLEQTRASLVAAPEAAIVARSRMEALKTELYTRDRCQERGIGQSHSGLGRCGGPLQRPGGQAQGSCCQRRGAGLARTTRFRHGERSCGRLVAGRQAGQFLARIVVSILLERGRQSFTGALAAIVGDRNVEINDGRSTTDPICLPAVDHGGECEVSANGWWHVGQTLGRSATSSLHACRLRCPIHTKLGLEREETSGGRGVE